MTNTTPKFFTRLFKWFCEDDFFEELQGDLEEKFFENIEKYSVSKANHLYRKEVIQLIRPSVIGKPKKIQQLMMSSLIKMNLKLAMRNMVRNKAFSAINIFGLALALCVSMFIANILYTGYQFDSQHADKDRIYRILNTVTHKDGDVNRFASMPYRAVEELRSDIPDFEAIAHMKRELGVRFKINKEEVNIRGLQVDEGFFEVFNFEVLEGNPLSIFDDINSIIITEDIADRYFPDESAIGKITTKGLVVKAIIKSPKLESHLEFESLSRLESLESGVNSKRSFEYKWGHYLADFAYVKVRQGSNKEALQSKLEVFSDKINDMASSQKDEFNFSTQPLHGITFAKRVQSDPGFTIGRDGLISYVVMIALMLFIASFNYTNLSVSRAIKRTKEIGIRKVSGSTRNQIIWQILCETLMLSFVSLLIGLGAYMALSNDLLAIIPALTKIFNPSLPLDILLLFALFTLFTGLVAGVFPAFFFAGINPLNLFNPRVKSKKLSFMTIRKVLVTFQLTLSMFALLLTILIQKQINTLVERPKGFETADRFILNTDIEKASLLKTAFTGIAGIDAVTLASDVPGNLMHGAVQFFDPITNDTSLVVSALTTDEFIDEVIEPKLIKGEFFTRDIRVGTEHEVLVNEEFLELTGLALESALGTVLNNEKRQFKIVGVLQPMISQPPFMGPNQPFMIIAGKASANNPLLLVKLQPGSLDQSMALMKAAWEDIYPDKDFKPEAMEEFLQAPINEFKEIMKAQNFIAFAMIAIALLGQLGMAIYNAETRVKEICIRKVLGAGIFSVLKLLLKGTIIPLIIASAIACPIAYLTFRETLSFNMSNPLTPHIGHFSLGIGTLSLLIIGMVVSQTWRVAILNPAKSLRSE